MSDLIKIAAHLAAARDVQLQKAGLRLDSSGSAQGDRAALERYLKLRQDQLMASMLVKGMRLDAGEAALLDRELRYVETQVMRRDYPALKHRLLIPTNRSIPRGAATASYRMVDQIRAAKIVTGMSTDIPRADVFATEFPTPLRAVASSFVYDVMELQQAAMSGFPIDAERAMACRDSIEVELNRIAFFGDAPYGLPGLLNNVNVTVVAAISASGQTVWNSSGTIKTAAGILADITLMIGTVRSATNGLYELNTILLPTALMTVLRMTPWSVAGGSALTLASFLRENFPGITFEEAIELDTANAGGTGGRIVGYVRDETVVDELIAGEYEQLPPQPDGLGFLNIGWAVTGGTRIRKPKAVVYLDGATA
jgi:hypothetical protein